MSMIVQCMSRFGVYSIYVQALLHSSQLYRQQLPSEEHQHIIQVLEYFAECYAHRDLLTFSQLSNQSEICERYPAIGTFDLNTIDNTNRMLVAQALEHYVLKQEQDREFTRHNGSYTRGFDMALSEFDNVITLLRTEIDRWRVVEQLP